MRFPPLNIAHEIGATLELGAGMELFFDSSRRGERRTAGFGGEAMHARAQLRARTAMGDGIGRTRGRWRGEPIAMSGGEELGGEMGCRSARHRRNTQRGSSFADSQAKPRLASHRLSSMSAMQALFAEGCLIGASCQNEQMVCNNSTNQQSPRRCEC